jgi:hypothetical protein
MSELTIWSYVDSIFNKKRISDLGLWNSWVINTSLSLHKETIFWANEMNLKAFLPAKMQYDFFFHGIRAMKKPFAKWPKNENREVIDILQEFFKCSESKARQALSVLTPAQLDEIKDTLEQKGGLKSANEGSRRASKQTS